MEKELTMKERVEMYIEHQHRLGYIASGTSEQLFSFARFVDKQEYRGPLTVDLATKWVLTAKKKTPATWARRLLMVHGFAKYYKLIEPETEIPPTNLYGAIPHRRLAYIYSGKEISDLLKGTKMLTPIDGLKPMTFKYLLGLLAATGLRVSEAIRLKPSDVDFERGILSIHETKFHKSRLVPLHPTVTKALMDYVELRNKKMASPFCPTFFMFDKGRSLHLQQVEKDFRWLREQLGFTQNQRLYDFRHTFICRRLLQWYREGKNINQLMVYLSTYVGHAHVTDTYWYITATPELLAIASKRFEQFSQLIEGESHER